MWRIAWNNLRHDRLRTIAAIGGVGFAVTLITIQVAIFLGAVESGARLIRSTDADIWVIPERSLSADFAMSIPERRRYQSLGVPGVEAAGRLLVAFSIWRFRDGRQEAVVVVGVDDDRDWMRLSGKGQTGHLRSRAVVLDRREEDRFAHADGRSPLGEEVELNGHSAVVAGFVDGMTSFVTTPYVFCSYQAGLDFGNTRAGNTTFVVIKCTDGADVANVVHALRERVPDVEVLTSNEFAERSWRYWILGTGMGMSLGLSAGLAFVVGMVIVGQTMFTGVLAKLREFATLKAVGFDNPRIAGTILVQSVIIAITGYILGTIGTLTVAHYAGTGGTAVVLRTPPMLFVALAPLTLAMCASASLGAAAKAMFVAPAKVFR